MVLNLQRDYGSYLIVRVPPLPRSAFTLLGASSPRGSVRVLPAPRPGPVPWITPKPVGDPGS